MVMCTVPQLHGQGQAETAAPSFTLACGLLVSQDQHIRFSNRHKHLRVGKFVRLDSGVSHVVLVVVHRVDPAGTWRTQTAKIGRFCVHNMKALQVPARLEGAMSR